MEKKKTTQIATLIIAVIICIISLCNIDKWSAVGIYIDCPLHCRLLYPAFHANIIHAALNAWCLICISFYYDFTLWRLLITYLIAISIPSFLLTNTPTVGLSGLVFALLGSISFEVQRRLYFQIWTISYIGIGFLLPNTNALLHLYCYAMGFTWATLNKPIKIG